jgi:hypothetical protein
MLVAAAVLPHPPLLVPEVAAGAAAELGGLRAACRKAIDTVLASDVQRVVVIGGGAVRATFGPGARGSLAGFEVPIEVCVPGAAPTGELVLPLSATIGCWLLSDHRPGGMPSACPIAVEVVTAETSPQGVVELGVELAASVDRLGLLVMGDGSAALSPKAPRYVVEGAAEWQRGVDQALGSADIEALAALSSDDAHRYSATGRAAWQVLAGAAGAARARERHGATWRGTLVAAEAPYGVGYTVATWERVPE